MYIWFHGQIVCFNIEHANIVKYWWDQDPSLKEILMFLKWKNGQFKKMSEFVFESLKFSEKYWSHASVYHCPTIA